MRFNILSYSLATFSNFRLNQDRHGGAWCPKNAIKEDIKEWLQINLHGVHIITGLVTQVRLYVSYLIKGRFYNL